MRLVANAGSIPNRRLVKSVTNAVKASTRPSSGDTGHGQEAFGEAEKSKPAQSGEANGDAGGAAEAGDQQILEPELLESASERRPAPGGWRFPAGGGSCARE